MLKCNRHKNQTRVLNYVTEQTKSRLSVTRCSLCSSTCLRQHKRRWQPTPVHEKRRAVWLSIKKSSLTLSPSFVSDNLFLLILSYFYPTDTGNLLPVMLEHCCVLARFVVTGTDGIEQCFSTLLMSWTTFRGDFVLGPTS